MSAGQFCAAIIKYLNVEIAMCWQLLCVPLFDVELAEQGHIAGLAGNGVCQPRTQGSIDVGITAKKSGDEIGYGCTQM